MTITKEDFETVTWYTGDKLVVEKSKLDETLKALIEDLGERFSKLLFEFENPIMKKEYGKIFHIIEAQFICTQNKIKEAFPLLQDTEEKQ